MQISYLQDDDGPALLVVALDEALARSQLVLYLALQEERNVKSSHAAHIRDQRALLCLLSKQSREGHSLKQKLGQSSSHPLNRCGIAAEVTRILTAVVTSLAMPQQ